tara:strand:- start:224 stop:481 length:258 start_codon:yes stop_codon:yes gene_type:complete
MQQEVTISDFKEAIDQLPDDVKAEILGEGQVVDVISVKMELIKFTSELHKHNQGVDWETNKIKPKKITFDQVISDSQKLFDFLTK